MTPHDERMFYVFAVGNGEVQVTCLVRGADEVSKVLDVGYLNRPMFDWYCSEVPLHTAGSFNEFLSDKEDK